jgi:hypothetical protein
VSTASIQPRAVVTGHLRSSGFLVRASHPTAVPAVLGRHLSANDFDSMIEALVLIQFCLHAITAQEAWHACIVRKFSGSAALLHYTLRLALFRP